MSLSFCELQAVVTDLAKLSEARIVAVHDDAADVIYVTLRDSGVSSVLLCSVAPGLTRLHLIESRPTAPPTPRSFTTQLRKHLVGRRMHAIELLGSDRVVRLRTKNHSLIAEMTGRHTNLLLLNEEVVVGTLRRLPTRLVLGDGYTMPPAGGRSDGRNRFIEMPRLHVAIDTLYRRHELEVNLTRRRRAVEVRLDRAVRRLVRKAQALTTDLRRAEGADDLRQRADILGANVHRLASGMTSITLPNLYDQLAVVTIPLRPELSPRANIDALYHKARRAQRGIELVRERLQATEASITTLHTLVEQCESVSDIEGLSVIEGSLERHDRPRSSTAQRHREAARTCYRAFVSESGVSIWVGRSRSDNDRLTFGLARGSDLWLHAAGWKGAHVIVRLVARQTADRETLLDAASLAAHYSRGSNDTVIEVHYAPVKRLRKRKGVPGLVSIIRPRSVSVGQDRMHRLRRLLNAANRD